MFLEGTTSLSSLRNYAFLPRIEHRHFWQKNNVCCYPIYVGHIKYSFSIVLTDQLYAYAAFSFHFHQDFAISTRRTVPKCKQTTLLPFRLQPLTRPCRCSASMMSQTTKRITLINSHRIGSVAASLWWASVSVQASGATVGTESGS